MITIRRRLVAATLACAGVSAAARDAAAQDAEKPAAPVPTKPATPPSPAPAKPPAAPPAEAAPAAKESDLGSSIDEFVGADVRGSLTLRYLARWTDERTDQDLIQYLDTYVGDESKDRWSGALSLRVVEDLDGDRDSDNGENVFYSLNDTFTKPVTALLYAAYANLRPESGPLEWARFGRQYGHYAESFQFDGASVSTLPLHDATKLRFTAYGGLPVHYYEASSSGDWLAGARASAEPWKGGRAALDYTHVEDELSYLGSGEETNDLTAVSLWQNVARFTDLYGQVSWLEGPRDATFRATFALPEDAFALQASYYQLLEDQGATATEFDAYTAVIGELKRYEQFDVHASKGFGAHFDLDAGVQARQLLDDEDEGPFNHETTRFYVTPTVSDLLWKGFSVSVTYDAYEDDEEEFTTWAADATYRISKRSRVSVGTDYSLYAFGPLDDSERAHVRAAYLRFRTGLTEAVSMDAQYTWERDDVETFQVFSMALVLDF